MNSTRKRCMLREMDEKGIAARLQQEGFHDTYVWEDGPNVFYPEHTHDKETAHVILSGEMTLAINGNSKSYSSGERCDVPAGVRHSAQMGPQGCRYLIGER
jgi:mannose-6-phosphate isomerase-like protein (cupin superfamily)